MLVGRSAEQRQLDLLLRRARAGISGVLVLRGDPGIGKTALVDYAASCAGPMRILRTTGIEAETGLAFAGLYSLLNPLADYLTDGLDKLKRSRINTDKLFTKSATSPSSPEKKPLPLTRCVKIRAGDRSVRGVCACSAPVSRVGYLSFA